jgi:hypothetical protein
MAPARVRVGHHRLDLVLASDVGPECDRGAPLFGDHLDRLLRGSKIAIDAQNARAFARKGDRGGTAVAHAFAGALAGSNHDGDTIFQPHVDHPRIMDLLHATIVKPWVNEKVIRASRLRRTLAC